MALRPPSRLILLTWAMRGLGSLFALGACRLDTFGASTSEVIDDTTSASTASPVDTTVLPTSSSSDASSTSETSAGSSGAVTTEIEVCDSGGVTGVPLWRKNLVWMPSGYRAAISAAGLDGAGNLVVGGPIVSGALKMGCVPASAVIETAPDQRTLFVAKMDPDGVYMWHRSVEGLLSSELALADIVVAANDDIYMAINFNGSLRVPISESETSEIVASSDPMSLSTVVLHLDSTGLLVGQRQISSTGNPRAFINRIHLDDAGKILVSGSAAGALDLAEDVASFDCRNPDNAGLGFVGVLTPALAWDTPLVQCIVKTDGGLAPSFQDAVWTQDGGIAATGSIGAQAFFQQKVWAAAGETDVLLLALSSAGELVAHGCMGAPSVAVGETSEEGTALVAGADGTLFVGMNVGDAVMPIPRKCNAQDGPAAFAPKSLLLGLVRDGDQFTPVSSSEITLELTDPKSVIYGFDRLGVDSANSIVTSGFALGNVDFGDGMISSSGGYDVIVAKYDCENRLLWRDYYGSSLDDRAFTMIVDGSDEIVVGGECDADFSGDCDADTPCAAFLERRSP